VGCADLARGSGLVGFGDRVEAVGGNLIMRGRTAESARLIAELPAVNRTGAEARPPPNASLVWRLYPAPVSPRLAAAR